MSNINSDPTATGGGARSRATAVHVGGAVVLAVLLGYLAAGCGNRQPPGAAAPSGSSTVTTTPSAPPSVTDTPSATVSDGPTESPDYLGLENATLDLTSWQVHPDSCIGGQLKFVNGVATGGANWHAAVTAAVAGDVDRDGATDVVAKFVCSYGAEWGPEQAVAFRRLSGGRFTTIGVVVKAAPGASDVEEKIVSLYDIAVAADGTVRVEVGDYKTGYTDPDAQLVGLRQRRGYRLNGTAFVQTSGSTTFLVNPPRST